MLIDVFPEGSHALPYNLLVWSTPKKTGKTSLNAAIGAYLLFARAPAGSELYTFANSQEQSIGRVFRAVRYTALRNPVLARQAAGGRGVLETMIHLDNGSTLAAMAAIHANIAGANPYYSAWTELWGYAHERELRAWIEMTPPPTITDSIRVVDTYAGYEGESSLLNDIEDQAKASTRLYADGFALPAAYRTYAESMIEREPALEPFLLPPGDPGQGQVRYPTALPIYHDPAARIYALWDEGEAARRMPWQQGEGGRRYYAAEQIAPGMTEAHFARIHLNRRATRGGQFASLDVWNALPRCAPWQAGDRDAIYLALDAATRDDHMSLVGVRVRSRRPEACFVRDWQPVLDPRDPTGRPSIDPSWAVDEILALRAQGMRVAGLAYDPYQFHAAALDLAASGITIREITQGVLRLEADTLLWTMIRDGRLAHDGDKLLGDALAGANKMDEHGKTGDERRLRIVKGTAKVDPLVALSMALWYAMGEPVGPPAAAIAPPPQVAHTTPTGRKLSPMHATRKRQRR